MILILFINKQLIQSKAMSKSFNIEDQIQLEKNTTLKTILTNIIVDYEGQYSDKNLQNIYILLKEVYDKLSPHHQYLQYTRLKSLIKDKNQLNILYWLEQKRSKKYSDGPLSIAKKSIIQSKSKPVNICQYQMYLYQSRLIKFGVIQNTIQRAHIQDFELNNIRFSLVKIKQNKGDKIFLVKKIGDKKPRNTPWIAQKTKDHRYIWRANIKIDKHDVKTLLTFLLYKRKQYDLCPSILINAGSHGSQRGKNAYQTGQFWQHDLTIILQTKQTIAELVQMKQLKLNKYNARNHIFINNVSPNINCIYPEHVDHIIDIQCLGAYQKVKKQLLHGQKSLLQQQQDLMFLYDNNCNFSKIIQDKNTYKSKLRPSLPIQIGLNQQKLQYNPQQFQQFKKQMTSKLKSYIKKQQKQISLKNVKVQDLQNKLIKINKNIKQQQNNIKYAENNKKNYIYIDNYLGYKGPYHVCQHVDLLISEKSQDDIFALENKLKYSRQLRTEKMGQTQFKKSNNKFWKQILNNLIQNIKNTKSENNLLSNKFWQQFLNTFNEYEQDFDLIQQFLQILQDYFQVNYGINETDNQYSFCQQVGNLLFIVSTKFQNYTKNGNKHKKKQCKIRPKHIAEQTISLMLDNLNILMGIKDYLNIDIQQRKRSQILRQLRLWRTNKFYQKALNQIKKIDKMFLDKYQHKNYILMEQGLCYRYSKQLTSSKQTHQKLLNLYKSQNNFGVLYGQALVLYAQVFKQMKICDLALIYFKQGLRVMKQIIVKQIMKQIMKKNLKQNLKQNLNYNLNQNKINQTNLIPIYIQIANIQSKCEQSNNYQKAIYTYQQCLTIMIQSNQYQTIQAAQLNKYIGDIYYKEGYLQKAAQYFEASFNIYSTAFYDCSSRQMLNILKILSQIYQKLKQEDKYIQISVKILTINDIIEGQIQQSD